MPGLKGTGGERLLSLLAVVAAAALVALVVAWLVHADDPRDAEGALPVTVRQDGGVSRSIRFAPASGEARASLEFEIPDAARGAWVLWLPRDPLHDVEVRGRDAQGQAWSKALPGFFAPAGADGFAPAGYAVALPDGLAGRQALALSAASDLRSTATPRVLPLEGALQLTAREMVFCSAIYAAWATLLIASLALYWAVRDRLFMANAAYTFSALVFMGMLQGHLYAMPGAAALGALGMRGVWIAMLVFNLSGLWLMLQFGDVAASRSTWVRRLPMLSPVVAAPLLLGVVPGVGGASALQAIAPLAWMLAAGASLWAMLDAARRGVPMAVAIATALLVLLATAALRIGADHAALEDGMLVRHGYQLALVMVSLVLFVGLSSRVGSVRRRLDVEASARRDSEERLRHEQVRARLGPALKDALLDAPEERIAPVVFRVLGEHVAELLGTGEVLVLAEGVHGHERLFVQAASQATATARAVQAQRTQVRNHALNRDPVEVRLAGGRRDDPAAEGDYLVVPLRVAAPAWAALVAPLSRSLLAEDREALAELARIALLHLDEAHAAFQLRHTAERDALTGSLNRRTLDLLLLRQFKAMGAEQAMSVLFIDIDWFKKINDTHGHACGDECLRAVAVALRGGLRPGDTLGRYGGEEFLVLLPEQDGAAARVVAERLREAVERMPMPWQGETLRLTASIGLASRRPSDADAQKLLARADKALYRAKHEGRNRVAAAPAYVE